MANNMRTLLFCFLAIFALGTAAVPHGPSRVIPRSTLTNSTMCTNPAPNSCSFYPYCLEGRYHCGSEGYPIGYGLHYCNAFTAAKSQLSPEGQAWVTKTMLCLQRALVPYATGQKSTSCDGLREYAFGTHPDCYVNSGVCSLSFSDWKVIVDTVSFTELFSSWEALKATMQTAGGCTEFYTWLIQNKVVGVVEDTGEAIEDAGEAAWDWVTSWF
ncbi:hypothetical protein PHISCL_05174 [Aspergillus sclerotialis]|uniref:Uncharacterized protein n=1 Tax=Aspergillus sclerotialis TaxID=2070753 RepID=A0A3A2ZH14_9EURO|nr:hypothetical protein PHISCL_05174 [Aspergillus sclerotialis]